MDPSTRTVTRRDRPVELTPKEYDLLLALLDRGGAVASRLELMREVWGYDDSVISRTIDTHIGELRRKLEADPAAPRHILTARKVGYRLENEVQGLRSKVQGRSGPRIPRMKLRRSWWLAAGLTAIAAVAEPATDAARSDSWPVGFRVMAGSYVPASAANSEARPLQISVWYPASPGKGKRMTYRDYVALNASELDPEKPAGKSGGEEAVEEFRSFLASAKILRSDITRMLSTPMKAIANAPAAKGRFPLVLISQGNGQSAHDQAFLAEALAARGYIAATVPSATRISGPMKGEEEIAAKATEQAEDLSHAAEQVKTRAELSEEGLAVVGHSFGARAALLFAMSNPSVRALVSLDGGIGVKTGRGMLERSRLFDAKAMTAPILHFYEELDPFMEPDFALIDSLDGSFRRLVKVPDMHHVHFNSAGSLLQRAPSLAAATRATPGTARSVEAV